MGIFDEYEAFHLKYQKIYGEKCVVLYQNGMFFEIYGIDNEKEKVGLVSEMSQLLNIQMTRRNKAILENDRSNFLMAGFPVVQLDRYVAILTEDHGYVVIVVEQVGVAPNISRVVANISAPGTNIKYLSNTDSNYLLSIYIEYEGSKTNTNILGKPTKMITIGISAIDVSTGHNIVYEVCNLIDDENRALDETYRIIQTLQPKEIVINSRNLEISQSELLTQLDLKSNLVHCHFNEVPPEYYKLSYQNEFLGKIFKQTGLITPIEFLDFERMATALISYILMLNFCYNQNENIINEIEHPVIWQSQDHLILDNNCINQLNLVSSQTQKLSCIFNLVDNNSTAMGRRLLKQKLLMPILDHKEIEKRYNYIDVFRQPLNDLSITNSIKYLPSHTQYYLFQKYEPHLKQISDIERYHRKICLGWLQPSEFSQLHESYQQISQIISMLEGESNILLKQMLPTDLFDNFRQYMDHYKKILNLDEIGKYNLNNVSGSFFNIGYDIEIDKIQDEIKDCEEFMDQLCQQISSYIGSKSDKMVSYNQTNDEYFLDMTVPRYNTFMSKCPSSMIIKIKNLKYSINPSSFEVIKNRAGKTCKITSKEIHLFSRRLIEAQKLLLKTVVEVYKHFLSQLYQDYQGLMKKIVILVSYIDFYKSNAKTSLLYNYCRPAIDTESSVSYLDAQQIRHPLIERFQETTQYVPQDICFNETQKGILLYGVNCSGKSSIMKAIGLNVIMAQSGLYVPATTFKYTPYKKILTRIVGSDNIHKGLSSFAVEMGELRGILKRADERSLVLGDEICHGTENLSGTSIVAVALKYLADANSNFLFATHLHSLSQMSRVIEIPTLKMYHLKVKCDERTGDLIYDRRLQLGAGPPIYGLEVLKSLGFDKGFLDLANEVRREIMEIEDDIVPIKKSRYNQQVYVNQCSIAECPNEAVDTHHIKFQSMANEQGFINHLQKNHKSNLATLCKSCHQMVHNDQPNEWRYIIRGYLTTTSGSKLDYEKVQNPPDMKPLKMCPSGDTLINPPKIEQETTNKPKKIILKKITK